NLGQPITTLGCANGDVGAAHVMVDQHYDVTGTVVSSIDDSGYYHGPPRLAYITTYKGLNWVYITLPWVQQATGLTDTVSQWESEAETAEKNAAAAIDKTAPIKCYVYDDGFDSVAPAGKNGLYATDNLVCNAVGQCGKWFGCDTREDPGRFYDNPDGTAGNR